MKRLFFIFYVGFILIILSNKGFAIHPAFELYQEAINDIKENKLKGVRGKLQQVSLMYPHSAVAMRAQLISALINYAYDDYITAALDADKYISMYPHSHEIDYVYYLLGMSYYKRIDIIERDDTLTLNAATAFNWIVQNSPKSKYAVDAQNKYNETINYLAAKEMKVGMFYLYQTNYIPAIRRFTGVIKNYKNTRYVAEAMYRLSEIFTALSLDTEAQYYSNQLQQEYPDSNYAT